ncbi:unnamed protein product, partial [Cylicostephanus goldi]
DSDGEEIYLEGRRVVLQAPSDIKEFEEHLRSNSEAKIISSGLITRLIASQSSFDKKVVWVSTHRLKTLCNLLVSEKEMSVGANLTISEKLFDKYSSLQVANVASWAGGFFSGSSDLSALFLAVNPNLTIRDTAGVYGWRHVSELVDESGRANLGKSQFAISMSFPRSKGQEHVGVFAAIAWAELFFSFYKKWFFEKIA